jgi:hypothetical protein
MADQVPVSRAVGVPTADFLDWMRKCVQAGGGDPSTIRDEPARFLRMSELVERSGLSEATIYRLMRIGQFPQAVPLTMFTEQLEVPFEPTDAPTTP